MSLKGQQGQRSVNSYLIFLLDLFERNIGTREARINAHFIKVRCCVNKGSSWALLFKGVIPFLLPSTGFRDHESQREVLYASRSA